MIVKFFKNKGGGSPKASIDYLAGKNRDREEARVLKGDPDLSESIAESLEFKNKYTVGCLSFEEANIPEKDKKEIMEKFEKTFMAGLEKEQYNITWIEHLDKGRLELNFFIPNVELESGKRLQPYYDKADRHLADNFKKTINYEYGLSNPDLEEKKQLVKTDLTTPRPTKEFKEDITKLFAEKIADGSITSREQIEKEIQAVGLEITRTTDNSISIKNPDPNAKRNIRLDGEIYKKEFYEEVRAITEFKEQHRNESTRDTTSDRTRKGNCEGISKEDHERNLRNLQKGIEGRTQRHKELYPEKTVLDNSYDGFDRGFSFNHSTNEPVRNEVERRYNEAESNENTITTIRTVYETRSSADERRQRVERNIHIQQIAKERHLQNERSERIKNTRIEVFINEISKRAERVIAGARVFNEKFKELAQDIREQFKGISSFISNSKERAKERTRSSEYARNSNQELKNNYQEIGERNRELEKFKLAVKSRESAFKSRESEFNKITEEVKEVSVSDKFREIIQNRLQEAKNKPNEQSVKQKESSWDLEM